MLDPLSSGDEIEPPRIPRLTNGILGAFAGVALGDWLSGGIFTALGLLIPGLVWEGDFHRLLASLLLHGSVVHLLINSLVLLVIGPAAERLYGRLRVVLVFLLSGLAGMVVSMTALPGDAAAGASGAVMGVCGLLIGFVTLENDDLTPEVESRLKLALALAVVFELLPGLWEDYANNMVHIGGIATGLLLSVGFSPLLPHRRRRLSGAAAGLAAAAALGYLLHLSQARVVGTLPAIMMRSQDAWLRGDLKSGIALLEEVIDAPPGGSANRFMVPEAQNQLAWFYVEAGRNLARGIQLSEESNRTSENRPMFLDTLGYLYALAGRCRDAADVMGRAADLDPAYTARRDEVNRSCASGRKPNTEIPVDPPPTPTPSPAGIRVQLAPPAPAVAGRRQATL